MLFINKKEFFKDNGCKGIINWEDGRLLYGCSTYDKDKKKVKITIVWDFVPEPNDRYFILMKNIKNNNTNIIEIVNEEDKTSNIKNKFKKMLIDDENKYYYDIETIEENNEYTLSLNYLSNTNNEMRVSNTLQITASKQQIPDNNIQLNGSTNLNPQKQLFDNLKNKTFDIYL